MMPTNLPLMLRLTARNFLCRSCLLVYAAAVPRQGQRRFSAAVVLLIAAALMPAFAVANVVPKAPVIKAKSYLIQDFSSGRVLAEQNADVRMEPASLTKIMTAYVLFSELRQGNISMQDAVRISEKAWKMPGSRMFIEVNTSVSVENLLKGMIIQSGNDASVALAEHVAGSEEAFADLMNQYARRLGMRNSNFANAEGLPNDNHYTTSRDMALLTRALIRDFPEPYKMHSIRQFQYNGITQYNRNKLLRRDASVDGVKTGYTRAAGYCLITSAKKEGMRLISVIMGAGSPKTRVSQTQTLLSYGFRFFETHQIYAPFEKVTQLPVFKGDADSLALGLARPLWVTVGRGQYKNLSAAMEVKPHLVAPVKKGVAVGKVVVSLDGKTVAERDLLTLAAIHEGSLTKRLTDHIRLWLAD